MNEAYLEVTFRKGRPLAAYYYLPRRPGQKAHKSLCLESGLVVDLNRSGKPIGIEITAPEELSLAALNRVMRRFGLSAVRRADIAPLLAP
jgi:hypothetical protein